MNVAEPFIKRPIGTSLLSVGLLLAGIIAYRQLPVAPLPQVEFPVIAVGAALPGASPETMASAVATPLERQFGRIAGVTEMTSVSLLGASTVILQFDLSRNIDAAARDVQAAINAARSQLPPGLPNNPTYRKVNPGDAPIMIVALTSDILPVGRLYDAADSILAQKLSQVEGIGQVIVGGGAKPAVRAQVDPGRLSQLGLGLEDVRAALRAVNANSPKGALADGSKSWVVDATDQLFDADHYRPVIIAYQKGAPVRLGDVADEIDDLRQQLQRRQPCYLLAQYLADAIEDQLPRVQERDDVADRVRVESISTLRTSRPSQTMPTRISPSAATVDREKAALQEFTPRYRCAQIFLQDFARRADAGDAAVADQMRPERPVTLVMSAFAVQVKLEGGQRERGIGRQGEEAGRRLRAASGQVVALDDALGRALAPQLRGHGAGDDRQRDRGRERAGAPGVHYVSPVHRQRDGDAFGEDRVGPD